MTGTSSVVGPPLSRRRQGSGLEVQVGHEEEEEHDGEQGEGREEKHRGAHHRQDEHDQRGPRAGRCPLVTSNQRLFFNGEMGCLDKNK